MAGPYTAFELLPWVDQDQFKVRKRSFLYLQTLLANEDASLAAIIPAKALHRIRLTDVWFNCWTSAAAVLTIQDDATDPLQLAIVKSDVGVGGHHYGCGEIGLAATAEKNVDLIEAGKGGYAGILVIEGYYEALGPFTPATL